jgi:hypothetical protein
LQNAEGGGGTAGVRYMNLVAESVDVYIEEQNPEADAETHKKETIGYLVLYSPAGRGQFKKNLLFHDTVVEFGTVSSDQSNLEVWQEVPIRGAFLDPVVVMGPSAYTDEHPTIVRVKGVTVDSFWWQF